MSKRTRLQRWWPFVLLCFVAASRWIISERFPSAGSSSLSLVLGCASAAVVVLTIATMRRVSYLPSSVWFKAGFAGALTICGPFAAILLQTHVDAAGLTMALALVPVVIAVARPAFRQTEGAELAGRLWPGIVAVSGLLLLLPQPSLSSVRSDVVLAVAMLATGIGAAWFRTVSGIPIWRMLAALVGACVVFGTAAATSHGFALVDVRSLSLAAAMDGAVAVLSVAALLRIGMTRWSAQFVLVPLVILLEGLLLLRPSLDVRSLIGLGLLLFASVFLLLPPRPDEPGEIVPR